MTDKGESLVDCYRKWRAWADAEVCCDYGLHSLVSWWEEGTTDREMEQLATEEGWREGRRGGEGNGVWREGRGRLREVEGTSLDVATQRVQYAMTIFGKCLRLVCSSDLLVVCSSLLHQASTGLLW